MAGKKYENGGKRRGRGNVGDGIREKRDTFQRPFFFLLVKRKRERRNVFEN